MKYLKIANQGLIEIQALHLVGASTKRDDNTKIGQFGSGNKYALAYLLRNGYEVKIFSGLKQIDITTKVERFRDCDFSVIHLNSQRTSITTDMGKDWELWQAVREIYCNALDEGGAVLDFVNEIEPKEDETHFYLNVSKEIKEFVGNFDNYFSIEKKVLFECPVGRIVEKTGTVANIYRRGIRCYETKKVSTFDYDFHDIPISENRTVMYTWYIDEQLWDLIFRCTDAEVIRTILLNCKNVNSLEGSYNDIATISSRNISQTFIDVLRSLNVCPREMAGWLKPDEQNNAVQLPLKVWDAVHHLLEDKNVAVRFRVGSKGEKYRETELTRVQTEVLKEARYFLGESGLKINYDIICADFMNKEILGTINGDVIVLSTLCLDRGVNETVGTIIEEYIHIKYHVGDETRAFQNAAITEFITYMKLQKAIIV